MKNFQFNKYMKNFQFSKYCSPAQLYLVLGAIGIISAAFNNYGIWTLLTHALFLVIWAWVLNWLCSKGFKAISWILVLLPFIFFLFTYFLTKDIFNVREGIAARRVDEGPIRAQVTAEMMAGGPTCENPKGGAAAPPPSDDDEGKGSGRAPKTAPSTSKSANTAPSTSKSANTAPAAKKIKEGLCETEQQKKARLQPLIDAEVAKRVSAQNRTLSAETLKQGQADSAARMQAEAAAEKKKKNDEAAAAANAGSSNDTRSYNKTEQAAKDAGVGLGSFAVGLVSPTAQVGYDALTDYYL